MVPKDEPATVEVGDIIFTDIVTEHNGRQLNSLEDVKIRVDPQLALRDGVAKRFGKEIGGAKVGETRAIHIKLSDNVASQYGWYQIGGSAAVKAPNAMVPGSDVFMLAATPGSVDDTQVNGEQVVTVNKNSVRFIVNGATAAGVFGTPFGARRNLVQNAITNTANAALFKRFRLTERVSAEFHASATNVFNHPNFQSIDPVIEDAGVRSAFTGFGDPSVTNTVIGNALGQRIIRVGATVRF